MRTPCSMAPCASRSLAGPPVEAVPGLPTPPWPLKRGSASDWRSRSCSRASGFTRFCTAKSFCSRPATCRTLARLESAATIQVVAMTIRPLKVERVSSGKAGIPFLSGLARRCGTAEELAEHVGQDAAVLVIVDLDGGVDPRLDLDGFLASVGLADPELELLLRPDVAHPQDVDRLVA